MTAPQRSQLEALLAEMRSLLIRLESLAAGLPARSPLRGQLEAIARDRLHYAGEDLERVLAGNVV